MDMSIPLIASTRVLAFGVFIHILREASGVARSTNRAMRRPLMVGRATSTALTLLFLIAKEEKHWPVKHLKLYEYTPTLHPHGPPHGGQSNGISRRNNDN